MCIPFAWTNDAVRPITYDSEDWIGQVEEGKGWYYADYMLLLTLGGIPWQASSQDGNSFCVSRDRSGERIQSQN